jgi:prephenate dehydratase
MDSKLPIIRRNLNIAASSISMARHIRFGQAEELARLHTGKTLTYSQIVKLYTGTFSDALLTEEYITFCKHLVKLGIAEKAEYADLVLRDAAVSYLKNNYCDAAFHKFSQMMGATAVYETDFNSVCESVYSGNSTYAIVPLFNTNDGLIVSLYRMILRYELKAVMSTDIMMSDDTTETKFMLLSRRMYTDKEYTNILFSFTDDTNNTLPGLLTVCAQEGIKLRFINTLPLEYTDDRREIVIDMSLGKCDKQSVLLFLKTALPDINIIGMYKAVK